MMDHKIRYTGGKKAGWTWECSCGESDRTPYAEAFERTFRAKTHLDEVRAEMEPDDNHDCANNCDHCELDIEMARSFNESEDYSKAFARENCDRNHNDEWVEVDRDGLVDLQLGARIRQEWLYGASARRRLFVHRDDLPDPDAEAVDALRKASWHIPFLADGSRPDPLPGLPEARALLTALHEADFDVVRKAR